MLVLVFITRCLDVGLLGLRCLLFLAILGRGRGRGRGRGPRCSGLGGGNASSLVALFVQLDADIWGRLDERVEVVKAERNTLMGRD